MVTQQQFLDFLTEIEPSSSTVATSSSAHRTLRAALRNEKEFSKYHIDTFLSGSYRRSTAIRPAKVDGVLQRPDIDIIVETTHSTDDKPKAVLDLLYNGLKGAGYESLTRNRRSVAVSLATVDMDVVPVIAGGPEFLIPDVELKEWLPTNPDGHTEWTVRVNATAGGRFKPLVKLLKWWRRLHLSDVKRPKGFILECVVAQQMNYANNSYEQLFVALLEAIRDTYQWQVETSRVPFLEDPSVPGNNVFSNVTVSEFKRFHAKVKTHAGVARKACDEKDSEKSLGLWREIFGSAFPPAGAKKAAESGSLVGNALGVGLTFPPRPVVPNKPQGFA
jgi:hypothetical protein